MILGDIETVASDNQSREMHYELSLAKFNFKLNYSSDSLYGGFRSE